MSAPPGSPKRRKRGTVTIGQYWLRRRDRIVVEVDTVGSHAHVREIGSWQSGRLVPLGTSAELAVSFKELGDRYVLLGSTGAGQ